MIIYFTYDEFIRNYDNDFQCFKLKYFDVNENEFVNELKKLYKIAINNVTLVNNEDYGCIDTVASTTGRDLNYKIYNNIISVNANNISEFDLVLINQFNFTFNKILEYLKQKSKIYEDEGDKEKVNSKNSENSSFECPQEYLEITQDEFKQELKLNPNHLSSEYSDDVMKMANLVFFGEWKTLDILYYLNDNFDCEAKNFTQLTKFNQIYFFLNRSLQDSGGTVPKGSYKSLIKRLFKFEYDSSDVKGYTEKHQITLGNLLKAFYSK